MRVAIVTAGHHGDVALATPVLRYREELWGPSPEVWWYAARPYDKVLIHNPYVVLQIFDGTKGLNQSAERGLDMARKRGGFDKVYDPAPYRNKGLFGKVHIVRMQAAYFGLDDGRPWRPVAFRSANEDAQAAEFVRSFGGRPAALLETRGESGQARLSEAQVDMLVGDLHGLGFVAVLSDRPISSRYAAMGAVSALSLDLRLIPCIFNACRLMAGVCSAAWTMSFAEGTRDDVPRIGLVRPDAPVWMREAKGGSLAAPFGRTCLDFASFREAVSTVAREARR